MSEGKILPFESREPQSPPVTQEGVLDVVKQIVHFQDFPLDTMTDDQFYEEQYAVNQLAEMLSRVPDRVGFVMGVRNKYADAHMKDLADMQTKDTISFLSQLVQAEHDAAKQ